jgi:hypothetical protein
MKNEETTLAPHRIFWHFQVVMYLSGYYTNLRTAIGQGAHWADRTLSGLGWVRAAICWKT